MTTEQQIKLRFNRVDFPVVNFHSEGLFAGDENISVKVEPHVHFPKDAPDHFTIVQRVTVSVENKFELFIVAIGYFELWDVIDERMRHNFVNLNAPAIMFPYIRSFIATFTSNIGAVTGTLNIPPQFFKGELPIISDSPAQPNETS